jgi:hypothetical protein
LFGSCSVERDADPLLVAPDRVAAMQELIGLDCEREGCGQVDWR